MNRIAIYLLLFLLGNAKWIAAESGVKLITARGTTPLGATMKFCRDDGTVMYSNVPILKNGWMECGTLPQQPRCSAMGERYFGPPQSAPHGYLGCENVNRVQLFRNDSANGVPRDLVQEYRNGEESDIAVEDHSKTARLDKVVLRERKRWTALRQEERLHQMRAARQEGTPRDVSFMESEAPQALHQVMNSLSSIAASRDGMADPQQLMEQMVNSAQALHSNDARGEAPQINMDEVMKSFEELNQAMGQ